MIPGIEVEQILKKLYANQELDKLIEYCSEHIATGTSIYLFYGARGKAYFDLKHYQEAVTDLTVALKLHPSYPIGLYNRGLCYLETEQYKLAILDFKLAHALDSKLSCHDLLGLAYLSLGKDEKAVERFSQYLEKQSDNIVLAWRAEAYVNLDQYKKALQDYELILLSEAKDQEYLEHLKNLNNYSPTFSEDELGHHADTGSLDLEKNGFVLCPHSHFHIFFPNVAGVYILEFANGEFYAGQTKKLISRLRSHQKVYDDIIHIYFRQVPEIELLPEEDKAISLLELNQCRIRNLKQIKFSNLFNQDCQKQWLSNLNYNSVSGTRFNNDLIRAKYKERFNELKGKTYFESSALLLAAYIKCGIPNYIASEYNYWQITCLPKYLLHERFVSRTNINSVPVLSVYVAKDESLRMMLCISKLPFLLYLETHSSFNNLFDDIPSLSLEIRNAFENSEGDEIVLHIKQADFQHALDNEVIRAAIRSYNLRMMNNVGKESKFRRNPVHCLDLSDLLINSISV